MKKLDFFRLIDANLNRAKEGLRVVEDTLRFIFNNKQLFIKARKIRHKLTNFVNGLYPELIKYRDVENDSGRKIKEEKRKNIKIILISNLKRSQESIRVLEEYSKLISQQAANNFKKLRYELYILEKKLYLYLKKC